MGRDVLQQNAQARGAEAALGLGIAEVAEYGDETPDEQNGANDDEGSEPEADCISEVVTLTTAPVMEGLVKEAVKDVNADEPCIDIQVTAGSVTWNGEAVAFLPGTAGFDDAGPGIHAPVEVPAGAAGAGGAGRLAFSFPLALNGTRGFDVAPFGETTVVELESDFPSPSFRGTWLPTERSVTGEGFTARWSIPFLGRNYPQAWSSARSLAPEISNSRFGVELVSPVDHYSMARRSVKYAVMFIFLTFAAVWLMEVLAGVRVHPIQYLLIGAALAAGGLPYDDRPFTPHLTVAYAASAEVRGALKEDSRKPEFIRTVYGFGYAFSGEVHEGGVAAAIARPAPAWV